MAIYLGSDLSGVEEFSSNEPVPAGRYTVRIKDVREKSWPNSGERYLELWYEVIEDNENGGRNVGRIVFDKLSLWTANSDWKLSAFRRLKSIAKAMGLLGDRLEDAEELVGGILDVKVKVNEKGYNSCSMYYRPEGGRPAATSQPSEMDSAPW